MATLDTNIKQVNADFQAIKNKIVEKGVEVANGTRTAEYAEKIDAVYDKGKQDERNAFWNVYLADRNTQYLFYSARWSDATFYPTKNIDIVGTAHFAFSSNQITNLKQRLIDCGVSLDTSKVTEGSFWFAYCGRITNIPTVSFEGLTTEITTIFDNCPQLKEIEKIILKEDGSTTFKKWFDRLPKLEDITFEGVIGNDIDFSSSTLLSKASITSIINHLSNDVSGKTLTLSKTAVEDAFAWYDSDGNKQNSLDGIWWELVDSKSNWTITLV